MSPLLTFDGELRAGTIVDRPNRFVVRVRFGGDPERAFLGDPGALAGIVEPGREVLCSPVEDPDRATDFDAIAVLVDGVWVSVRTALANDLFERALARDALPPFVGYACRRREPALPEGGRTDFLLDAPDGSAAYVEVKSCTHVEDGVAKFPDRQTERGRRHLRSLEALREDGADAAVIVKPAGSASLRGTETFERCHEVAEQVNGGGHPRAAGCKPDIYDDMLDYAHHWTTRGAVAKQAIVDAFRRLEWDEEAESGDVDDDPDASDE